jgi:hypothetical protein
MQNTPCLDIFVFISLFITLLAIAICCVSLAVGLWGVFFPVISKTHAGLFTEISRDMFDSIEA